MDSTKKMINSRMPSTMMKDGVVILNFARDLLVDEDAVVLAAIDAGKVTPLRFGFPKSDNCQEDRA